MRKYKLLVLDADHRHGWALRSVPDVQFDAVFESTLGATKNSVLDYDNASSILVENISTRTKAGEFDFIIVGNNVETGVSRAKHIADDMKPKTLVLWNHFVPGCEIWYANLGFTHFGSRENLDSLLSDLVRETVIAE